MGFRIRSAQVRPSAAHRLAAALLLAGFACKAEPITPPTPVTLSVFPDTATIVVGDSVFVEAVGTDANGHGFVGLPTTWSSRNPAIATVSATGLVKGKAAGTDTIVATSGGLSAQGVITVVPPPQIKLSHDSVGFSAIASGPNPGPDSVIVTNAGGATLSPTLGTISYGAGATGWLSATLSSPTAPDTLVLTAQTGTIPVGTYVATVPVTDPKASNSPHNLKVTFTIGVGAAATIAKNAGDGQSATAGTAVAVAPSVIVRDQYNNPVPNVSVTFAVTVGGGSITGATQATNVSGIATVGSWTLGTTAGPNGLSATSGTLTGSPVSFTATAVPGPATKLVFTTQPTTAQAGVPITPAVQVSIEDALGNVTSSTAAVTVAIGTNAGGGTLSGTTTIAAAAGVATFSNLTIDKTGTGYTLAASSGSLTGATSAPFNIIPNTTPAGSKSSVTASVGSITASSGTSTSLITATVRDTFSNLIPGAAVVLSSTGTGNSFSPAASGTTNGSGVFTANFSSTTAEAKTISATVNGSVLVTQTASVSVTAGPVSGAASLLSALPTTITASSGTSQTTITATVRDQFSNPISGATVVLASNGTGNTITQPGAVTSASGQTSGALSSTVAESKTVSAAANGTSITQTASVTVNAAGPYAMSIFSGNAVAARVGTGVSTTPSVLIVDAFNNPVPNVTVMFGPVTGGGSVTGATAATNASGVATLGSWTLSNAVGDSVHGTYVNTVTAGTATLPSVMFTDSAYYSLANDVMPVFSGGGCSGCHSSGFPPDFTSATTFVTTTVGVTASCNAADTRVVAKSWSTSLLALLMNATGGCTAPYAVMPPGGALSGSLRRIVSDWVNHNALNN